MLLENRNPTNALLISSAPVQRRRRCEKLALGSAVCIGVRHLAVRQQCSAQSLRTRPEGPAKQSLPVEFDIPGAMRNTVRVRCDETGSGPFT